MGKTRVIAETGAGQHGVATATAAAFMGLECEVFMGEEDTIRQALNVYRMELLGAKVHARNESQEKIFELEDFYESYRSTKLGKDELITAISFPLPPEGAVQEFHKRGSRATLTLSRMSLAFLSSHLPDGGYDIRIAAGSMSPVPFRLKRTEAYIRHHPMTAETLQRAIDVASGEINPRKSGEYRRYLSLECMRKHLQALENA